MNIYQAAQIKEWDAYTIQHEPVASIDLMERAAQKCVDWIIPHTNVTATFKIICGKGNNGGDGLAIARLLLAKSVAVEVHILESGRTGSDDFQQNLERLRQITADIHFIQSPDHFPPINSTDNIIDALFGSGLNKPLEGVTAGLVQYINQSHPAAIIAIDVPSGLFMDQSSVGNIIIETDHTLTFQCYKLGLLVAENAPYFGKVHVLDIGLHARFPIQAPTPYHVSDENYIKNLYKPRKDFAHKGTYGHGLLIAGSYGKMGAAVLAAKACLRAGVGLLTTYIPACGYQIMQTSVPEAMAVTDDEETYITGWPNELDKYSAIGIGPGIGTAEATKAVVLKLLTRYKNPMVIDADALNCLAMEKESLVHIPAHSIVTPHPKEFERLFGTCQNDFERIAVARQKAVALNMIIVLKGHHTLIALPNGQCFFNTTGNAGMASGGTGDVLTGIITSLLAQHYKPEVAAILGVYLHGLAGDLAAGALSEEALIAGDVITFLSQAFLQLRSLNAGATLPS